MAQLFVAILISLAIVHYLPEPRRVRNFSWLRGWQAQGARQASAGIGLVLSIGLPVLLCLLVQFALHATLFGLPALVFAVAIFTYCMGPRDLERDVEAVDKAPDTDARDAAAQALRAEEAPSPLPFRAAELVESAFIAALRRVFGVIFWFVLLGPAGALLYRITSLLAYTPEHASALPIAQQDLARRFARALDWLPAHLIALALALASDFDAVFKAWRDYHAALPSAAFSADPDFLNVIARASVDADVAGGDGHVVDVHEPLVALDDAMTLIRRVLIVWIALIALVVIGGWFT
ncbi:MAG: regulatory signaling modulator protein AmpE [Rudaea sp.]